MVQLEFAATLTEQDLPNRWRLKLGTDFSSVKSETKIKPKQEERAGAHALFGERSARTQGKRGESEKEKQRTPHKTEKKSYAKAALR